jgi:hypothetical protein
VRLNGLLRLFAVVFLMTPWIAEASDKSEAISAVQRVFDGMASRDAGRLRESILPDARLYAVRDEAAPSASTSLEAFVTMITTRKDSVLERFTGTPQVLIRGRLAQVWGSYEFWIAGQFSHCGTDSASLYKTAEGWKVATIVYTVETKGCRGH